MPTNKHLEGYPDYQPNLSDTERQQRVDDEYADVNINEDEIKHGEEIDRKNNPEKYADETKLEEEINRLEEQRGELKKQNNQLEEVKQGFYSFLFKDEIGVDRRIQFKQIFDKFVKTPSSGELEGGDQTTKSVKWAADNMPEVSNIADYTDEKIQEFVNGCIDSISEKQEPLSEQEVYLAKQISEKRKSLSVMKGETQYQPL